MLHKTVLDYHQIFSFDVKSLLTGVPLQKAIDLKLERIFDLKEINTAITRHVKKELLLLCTRNVRFGFDDCVYLQNEGVAMGLALRPALDGIRMVEQETKVVPTISYYIANWKSFVDDTVGYVKNNKAKYKLKKFYSSKVLHKKYSTYL